MRLCLGDKQEKRLEYAGWTAFFLLCLLRFSYYGLRYFPQLDDYIQYHNYAYGKDFAGLWSEVQRLGLFGARPLAGLADLYVWSAFWECPYAAVLLLTLMFALSALLLRQVFSRYFRTGGLFYVIYLLFPLNFEGTYWMSASTRICAGLFFTALSAVLLIRFLERPRVLTGILQLLVQLAACCFYEQLLVLSCALMLLLWFLERKKGRRVLLAPASAAFSALSYLVCVRIFADSPLYRGREGLVLPTSSAYFTDFLPGVLRQLYQAWIWGSKHMLLNGMRRGAELLRQDGNWLYIALGLLLSVAAGVFAAAKGMAQKSGDAGGHSRIAGDRLGFLHEGKPDEGNTGELCGEPTNGGAKPHTDTIFNGDKETNCTAGERAGSLLRAEADVARGIVKTEAGATDMPEHAGKRLRSEHVRYLRQIACGLILALAPMAVFFAVSNTWYSLRNIVPSLPGVALVADGVLQWLLCRTRKQVRGGVCALLTFLLTVSFLTVSVSELHDYRQTWEDDQTVLSALNEFFDGKMPEDRVAVLNLEPSYLTESNFSWHEHIHGVTESRWALCGALTAQYLVPTPYIFPIPLREELYANWNYDDLHISGFSRVLWYDPDGNTLEEAEVTDCGDGVFEVRCHGETVLIIREEGRSARAELPG